MLQRKKIQAPLALTAGIFIVFLALASALGLRFLFQLYARYMRSVAASSALQYGTVLAQPLLDEARQAAAGMHPVDLDRLGRLARILHQADQSLEYVTLLEDEVVVFHWQAPSGERLPPPALAADKVVVTPQVLQLGGHQAEVLDFRHEIADGSSGRLLHVGLHKNVLERGHSVPLAALTVMFRVALVLVIMMFGVCLLAVLGLVWREMRRLNRRRAEDSLAFAGAVAGSVIHDFRNPMSALRLDAQLLQHEAEKGDSGRPAKMRQLARRMEKTLGRMDDLLREFLALSAPGSNDSVEFDINACVRDCADLLRLRFERADVRLVLALAEEPLRAGGELMQFKRAVLNILNNAVHFAPAGSAVTVRSRRQGRQALLEISDEGPGIPPVERHRVFRMFYTRRPGGTGIGLALARTAVENCGGRIRVLTPPAGRGSLFALTLPLEL